MKSLCLKIADRNQTQLAFLRKFIHFKHVVFLNGNADGPNHLAVSNVNEVLNQEYQFGFVSYDYKNQIEQLESNHSDGVGFSECNFFTPQLHVQFSQNELILRYDEDLFQEREFMKLIDQQTELATLHDHPNAIVLNPRMTKEEYLEKVKGLKKHIQLGDIYEVNFCQEFYAEDTTLDPLELYFQLNQKSPTPFSCFVKEDACYLLCASPERYVQKIGTTLISQPIKGTISRGLQTQEDEQLKQQLLNDPKERSENVMIVDLVRNDLARIAQRNTVHVQELMGVYSFPQVHQLISTITAQVEKDINFEQVLKASFPMGSMTGAPKIRAMELIEDFEVAKRGIYSGTVGYISPDNDFDFNVIIRSITYNAKNKYLSYMVGGAITALSDPENEYKECLLKAKAMKEVLSEYGN